MPDTAPEEDYIPAELKNLVEETEKDIKPEKDNTTEKPQVEETEKDIKPEKEDLEQHFEKLRNSLNILEEDQKKYFIKQIIELLLKDTYNPAEAIYHLEEIKTHIIITTEKENLYKRAYDDEQ